MSGQKDDVFFGLKRIARLEALLKGLKRSDVTNITSSSGASSGESASVEVSDDPLSKYFFTNTDNTLALNTKKIRDVNSTHQVEYHKLPSRFLLTEPYTTSGAMSSAVLDTDLNEIEVTAGDSTSYMLFTNILRADWHLEHRLKVRVDTLGATSLLGLIFIVATGGSDLAPTNQSFIIDLPNEQVRRGSSNGGHPTPGSVMSTGNYNTSGANAFCQSGDVLEFVMTTDPYLLTVRITVYNLTRGYIVSGTQLYGSAADNSFGNKQSNIGFILSDGTYTIIDYTLKSLTPAKPLIALTGDSYASGYQGVSGPNILLSRLNATLPYNVVMYASSGSTLHGQNKSILRELMLMRPKVVVQISVLSPNIGQFISDLAAFQVAMDAQLLTVRSYGGINVLVKYEVGNPYANANLAAWAAYVDTQVAAYPGTLVLDLSAVTGFTYTNNHWSAVSIEIVRNEIIALLEANNLL